MPKVLASVRPEVKRYLQAIEERLRAQGLHAELLVMQSSGGILTFAAAAEKPVFMVESGPAAGVIAAAHLGDILGHQNVISFDMGGTTAKTSLIRQGQVQITKDYEVGVQAAAGIGMASGSGYPIKTPVLDLIETGAGGGSIAWVDSGGALRVGPQSAGADPGPVCYRDGGMVSDVEAAQLAIDERCAQPLGLDVVVAANGIVEIANAAMTNALRLVSIQHGYDPRDFVMIGFGGAGPVHANRLAIDMRIPCTVIPRAPGIFSAMGLLVTDLKHDFSLTCIRPADQVDAVELTGLYDDLAKQGRQVLEREGVPAGAMKFLRHADMRYIGQSYELSISVPAGELTDSEVTEIIELFHHEHDRAHGFADRGEPTELVNLRLTAVGTITKPQASTIQPANSEGAAVALRAHRPVYFGETEEFVNCPIYQRYRLGSGVTIEGPAIIEEFDSTTVVHRDFQVAVDRYGNLLLTPAERRDPNCAAEGRESARDA